MWTIDNYENVSRRLKKYQKKWSHEMTNVFDNLDTLHEALCIGTRPEQLKNLGFVHSEPNGILAIDQKGPGKGSKLKQIRLYIFPDEEKNVLHVIILGDKNSQEEDIKISTAIAKNIIEKHAKKAGGETRNAEAG